MSSLLTLSLSNSPLLQTQSYRRGLEKANVPAGEWDKLTCENVDATFDKEDAKQLMMKCMVNFGCKCGFRGNKEHTFLTTAHFKKTVFKDGPLKGVEKYEVWCTDKTHKLDLNNNYVQDSAFHIPIMDGTFGKDLEKYFKQKPPGPANMGFYTKPLSDKQIAKNKGIPNSR